MSKIGNMGAYKSLPIVRILDSNMNMYPLGRFESGFETTEMKYQSGNFVDDDGNVVFDDSKYKGKLVSAFHYTHAPFGYRFGRTIMKGHLHTMYVISENDINPYDVYDKSPDGDIVFFADKVNVISRDGGEFKLVIIRPHLNKEELSTLKNNVNEFAKIKVEYQKALHEKSVMESRVWWEQSARRSTEIMLQHHKIGNADLLFQMNNMVKNMCNSKVQDFEKWNSVIEDMEEKLDVNIDFDSMGNRMIQDRVEGARKHYDTVNKMSEFKEGGLDNQKKRILVRQLIDECGKEYVESVLKEYENDTLPVKTLSDVIDRIRQLADVGKINEKDAINKVQEANRDFTNLMSKGMSEEQAAKEVFKNFVPENQSWNKMLNDGKNKQALQQYQFERMDSSGNKMMNGMRSVVEGLKHG